MRTHRYPATGVAGFIADEENSRSWLFQLADDAAGDSRYETFVAGMGAIVTGSAAASWWGRSSTRGCSTRCTSGWRPCSSATALRCCLAAGHPALELVGLGQDGPSVRLGHRVQHERQTR